LEILALQNWVHELLEVVPDFPTQSGGYRVGMVSKGFVIFSGHNDRAVVALCRAFFARDIPLFLVASSDSDPVFKTHWASYVVLVRSGRQVDLPLFEAVRRAVPERIGLIYCPTTEFINAFVLENRHILQGIGIDVMLPPANVYARLSSKRESPGLVKSICGIDSPPPLAWSEAVPPCVFKPISNVSGDVVHYPILCFTERDVLSASDRLSASEWFVQRYVEGQSYYLCGYLSRNGSFFSYWQTNLLQQPNGKSIVLARTGSNPGLDENNFFDGLAEIGYFGPVMMEVIAEPGSVLNYIEINPRFWGPLQLGVDACPKMMDLYVFDAGFSCSLVSKTPVGSGGEHWYSWSKGAQVPQCRIYPAAAGLSEIDLNNLLVQWDVYARRTPPTGSMS
jgi:hypothetical protein